MKRFRLASQQQEAAADHHMDSNSMSMAGMLMLLSHSESQPSPASSNHRVFECKTCSRRFASFQALGGHRASHKKPRPTGQTPDDLIANNKPKVHECSVCGLEFAIGQALGGHMRRHRAEAGGSRGSGEKKRVWLDLNLPPSENENAIEWKKMGLIENIPMVDCFH